MSEMADRLRRAMGDSVSDQTDLEKFFPLQEVELADPNERQRRMSRKQHNPYDLSDEEIKLLRASSAIPDSVKQRYSRRASSVGAETTLMMKLAARTRAEVELKRQDLELDKLDGKLTDLGEANKNAIVAHSEVKRIAQERDELKEENLRLKSLPSMAVFSED